MFDVFAKEGKAVYKNKDTCPRELKLEKKNLLLTSADFQLLEEICFLEHSGTQGSDQRMLWCGWYIACLGSFDGFIVVFYFGAFWLKTDSLKQCRNNRCYSIYREYTTYIAYKAGKRSNLGIKNNCVNFESIVRSHSECTLGRPQSLM